MLYLRSPTSTWHCKQAWQAQVNLVTLGDVKGFSLLGAGLIDYFQANWQGD